ncbi:MAG TPA: VWA domain-containing protein, partial [Planctomycetaceae bacterium]|nr:VWA domain-containing protein [Planctomycetaceae bacterium]
REAGQKPAARRTGAKPFAADRFVRAFRSGSDEAKLAALLEVEQRFRDHPDLLEALWQAIQPARDGKKVTPALLAGVRLYAGIADAKQSDRQLHLLQSADARVVLAAAEGLAGRQAPDALTPIAALRLHPEYAQRYGFRLAVLSAVAKYPQPAAVDWLIETLSESDGQLKYEAARELARLTGENFGGRSDDWQKWWADHRAEFAAAGPVSPRPEAAVPSEMPWDESVPKFFSVPIYARRVVFVIDRSRSMQSSVDAVTRLDDAQRELELAVHGLPDGTLFNLVAYDTTLRLWRDRLVPADLKSRSESLRFIYSLYPDDKTACYDALEGALALDPNLELIVFLSDGEPTAGRITDPAQIVREITARNAASRVRIDVLGIDAQGQTEKFLKELAAANFGKYRAVR